MIEQLKTIIRESLIKSNYEYEEEITIEIPSNKEFGDYSSNIAMKICKKHKMNPIEIANIIISNINNELITKTEIKSPGFINFFVSKKYLYNNLNKILNDKEKYGSSNIGKNKKYNVEFVSANPTGILHLGNARGGAYGDSLARILKFSGFEVTKEYYVNDSGVQINKLGESLKARYLECCGTKIDFPEDGYHGEDIKIIAQELFNTEGSIHQNDSLNFFKNYGKDILINKIFKDLKSFGVEYDVVTSEIDIKNSGNIEKSLNEYNKKELLFKKEGATWFKGTDYLSPRDFVLVKSDGNYTYILPDIAHHMVTLEKKYDKLVNVLGADHHGYVTMIKSALMGLGYDEKIVDIKLLQLVKLIKNGEEVKMSKRTGNTVSLNELLEEVDVNAARYFFISRSLDTQMDFDLDLAKKQSNENPVYYINYAYARICSILNEHDFSKNINNYEYIISDDAIDLLKKIYEFPKKVEEAALKEIPYIIANYLYELATIFHSYYSKHKIVSDNKEETMENINLIKGIKITLNNAMYLLGINPSERM